MRTKLNFFCIGAAKCGTTTLHDILIQHPNIYLPKVKETKFFSLHYEKGIDWYIKEYFSEVKNEKIIGEIYPCMDNFDAPKRLYNCLGSDIKIIVMLRNPVDRAYSNYLAQQRIQKYNYTFQEALNEKPFLINKSMYAKNINRFLDFFSIDNMKFFIFEEDFLKDRQSMLIEVLDFLNLEKLNLNVDIKSNQAWEPKSKIIDYIINQSPQIFRKIGRRIFRSTQARQHIRKSISTLNAKKIKAKPLSKKISIEIMNKYFIDDISNLELLLKRDLSIWYK